MVFKGGFGFHTSEIEKRFGPDTLTVFLKVRFLSTPEPSLVTFLRELALIMNRDIT